jgi:alpha-beta hydrolase superfamily lysophospholipase
MTGQWRLTVLGVLAAGMMLALGSSPSMAAPSAHVYLLRGLMNIFSLGMDTLQAELARRGVDATVDNHSEWQAFADQAAANYRAGREGPIILIGHSLGADAVMQMADYLGTKGVPVALVVPFDATESFSASANVARVINFTKHYNMVRGPGFHGSLLNVDLRSDPNIDHLNIDKSPRLHARVIAEVLAIVGGHGAAEPTAAVKPATIGPPASDGTTGSVPAAPAAATAASAPDNLKPVAEGGTPVIALPERPPAKTTLGLQPN